MQHGSDAESVNIIFVHHLTVRLGQLSLSVYRWQCGAILLKRTPTVA